MQYGGLCHSNFYREVTEKNRVHYEYYNLGMTEDVPEDYTEISFVCLKEEAGIAQSLEKQGKLMEKAYKLKFIYPAISRTD